ncbi:ABC transporter permease [Acidisoma sp.]|uniref:ABC transporter permease n=1 Tax=Acidisoma sp. TaxID=1872115 RepID=UPI003B00E78E
MGIQPDSAGKAARIAEGEGKPVASPRAGRWFRAVILRPETGGAISALAVFLFFAILAGSSGFLTTLGTADWLDTASELGIIAIPVGMLMTAGEFDLSVGSVVGAGSMVLAIISGYYSLNPWIGVMAAVLVGALIGLINGLLVVTTRLPSFIVTLAMMLMVMGGMLAIAIVLTGSTSLSASSAGSAGIIFAAKWHQFQSSILIWLVLLVIATYVMQRTAFGNWIYATGGDENRARLAGVPTARVKIILFVCTSVGATLTGIIETMSFQNGNVTLGASYVFTGIAAAVIGGVLLGGGYGSPIGTMFGTLTYGIVSLGVFFLGWNADLTQLFIGLLLLLAVLANHRLRMAAMGRV